MQNSGAIANETDRAKERILDKARRGEQNSVTKLVDVLSQKPAIGKNKQHRKELAEAVALSLVTAGQLFEHPKCGNKSACFGTTPADPKKYFTKSGLTQFRAIYARLLKAKVPAADIVAAASAKLDPPFVPTVSGNRPASDWLQSAVQYLREFNSRLPSESCRLPDFFRAVAEPKGITLSEFHEGLRTLCTQGRVSLMAWTQPLYMLKEEQFALILDKEIRYYVRIA